MNNLPNGSIHSWPIKCYWNIIKRITTQSSQYIISMNSNELRVIIYFSKKEKRKKKKESLSTNQSKNEKNQAMKWKKNLNHHLCDVVDNTR